MPRYFFSLENEQADRDEEGTELPNDHDARIAAIQYIAQHLKDDPDAIWDGHRLSVLVDSESHERLMRVEVKSEGAINTA